MSTGLAVETSTAAPPPAGRGRDHRWLWLAVALASVAVFSLVRIVTGEHALDSPGSLRAALIATCPILMAAIGGLWSERAGVVNIGLEGQMILGTWGAAYFTYYYGPWVGILGAALLGGVGGALHALATVNFGVDHIVSGVAINLIATGGVKFAAEAYFKDLDGGGVKQLQGLDKLEYITVPGISDALVDVADKHWFLVSDLAAMGAAATTRVSPLVVLVFVLLVLTSVVLWRTAFGLRLRSCGENPQAAETLGVNVYLHKWVAVVTSGAMAGIGGGFLVAENGFVTGQTNERGYLGLAAMIFGNWRPGGIFGGAFLFGYTDSLRLRDPATIHALLLFVAIALLAMAIWRLASGKTVAGLVIGGFAVAFGLWFFLTDEVPTEFASLTPYLATLLVLGFFAQRLRMPKADGQIYRKGSAG